MDALIEGNNTAIRWQATIMGLL